MPLSRWFFALFLVFSLSAVFSADAHAQFDLSVEPRRGGQNIRFESAEPGGILRNEEVTLRVDTNVQAQYQIQQTIYQPLTNETGATLPISTFVEFSPSSPIGTLRTLLETPLTLGQKQIYTSNATGDSDEFVLVFNVRVPENQPGGVYRTQLTFTADLLNAQAGISPSTRTLDVRVEIDPKFRITIEDAKGLKTLDLGRITQEKGSGEDVLTIQIESNIGTSYRLFEQLTEEPMSPQGDSLERGTLLMTAAGGSQGTLSGQGASQALPQSSTLLYQSDPRGGSDQIQLQFSLKPPPEQKAGVYSGTLSFRMESGSPFIPNEVINIPIRVEVGSIFSLETEVEGNGLNFGLFVTGKEEQQQRVLLKVQSNLGEPYQVTQVVPRKMTNSEGAVIPQDHFRFYGEPAKTGLIAVPGPSPVREGDTLVFTSDKKGTPEQFILNYTLTVPKDAKAGAYNTELKYSITTL